MRRCKQYILMAVTINMLLAVGCQRGELIDHNDPDSNAGELRFSPSLAEAYSITRAGESDNGVLRAASVAGVNSPHIVIETYKGTPGSSLEVYFSDELGYFELGGYWNINSGIPRFLPSGGMNLYAYFATDFANKGDLDSVDYIHPATVTDHPKLTFTVPANDELNQVDLIAAKVEEITQTNIPIPFRHILSQINFGVKGLDQHQITIKNIRINKVMDNGSFDYKTWQWTPGGKTVNYPYYFPDRKQGEASSGLGEEYKTRGTPSDSQNSYFFGDGGKFGPGEDTTFLYAQVNRSVSDYATKDNTSAPLRNSLMLLPQEITKNTDATVTFDYEIKLKGQVVRSEVNSVVHLDAYYNWEPNLRYVYLFKFDDPQKVTFDVLVEPWENYNGGDGIVGTDELNSTTLFEKHIRPLKPGENYSVPLGVLSTDFICDWSLSTLNNSFPAKGNFTISFDNELPFVNGKSVIINPPFGFTASASLLNAPGVVTFTATYAYYSTSDDLNSAIGESGNYVFSVSDAVKLGDIKFTGSTTAESSLTLRYLIPYTGNLPNRWSMYDQNTVVCFPKDYALTQTTLPYAYTVYTVQGLKAVFDWMNGGSGNNPGGSSSEQNPADRMKTNITLAASGKYNLAEVYKASAADNKEAFVPIGNNSVPYTGSFDGKGATVENLYINSTAAFQGFFGDKRGNVDNLNLAKVSVTSAGNFIGGIAGYNGGGNIRNCSVSGSVSGNWTIGGIAGSNGSYIIGCCSNATVSSSTGGLEVGGICGKDGWINACYFTGNVRGTGGISGSGGTITSSYYVASSDIGSNNPAGTRLPSIAVLNSKIGELNTVLNSSYINSFKYVSGNLNNTPPSTIFDYPAVGAGRGVLKGTFIQNWFALYWDQNKWDEEMALLATLGMEYLVIDQVMECYVPELPTPPKYMAWYPATEGVIVVNTPALDIDRSSTALEKCMAACRAHGIKLFIGTFFDKRYWDGGAAVKGKETEWNNCVATANNVMNELTNFYFSGSSSSKGDFTDVLAGWYFPYEVDDLNFKESAARTILKNGISAAMTFRNNHAVNANKPYLFSPFMNGSGPEAIDGTMTAEEYAALWGDIIKTTGFKTGDILSPQDCIGIGKLTISDLAKWMPALKGAVTNGVEFWINVELFGPGGDVPFLTTQQIPASKPYATNFISFSYPIYYSPNSDRRVGDHNAYKAYYDAQ